MHSLVRGRFGILSAKGIGLAITLPDITEEECRVRELIEPAHQELITSGIDGVNKSSR